MTSSSNTNATFPPSSPQIIKFSSSAEISQQIKELTSDTLCILAYGVPYLPPIYQSLCTCQQVASEYQIPIYFLNEESERQFCHNHQIIVGTPFLSFYLGNGGPMQIEFYETNAGKKAAKSQHQRSNTGDSISDGAMDDEASHSSTNNQDQKQESSYLSNIYIGQINRDVLEYILEQTQEAVRNHSHIRLSVKVLEFLRGVGSEMSREVQEERGLESSRSLLLKQGVPHWDQMEIALSPVVSPPGTSPRSSTRPPLRMQNTVAVLNSPLHAKQNGPSLRGDLIQEGVSPEDAESDTDEGESDLDTDSSGM